MTYVLIALNFALCLGTWVRLHQTRRVLRRYLSRVAEIGERPPANGSPYRLPVLPDVSSSATPRYCIECTFSRRPSTALRCCAHPGEFGDQLCVELNPNHDCQHYRPA